MATRSSESRRALRGLLAAASFFQMFSAFAVSLGQGAQALIVVRPRRSDEGSPMPSIFLCVEVGVNGALYAALVLPPCFTIERGSAMMCPHLEAEMQFDFRKTLGSAAELAKLDSSLDDYLALEGTTLSRLKFKRRGPARSGMLETLAQMAMLFAAANMGDRNEYEACLMDILNQTVLDDGHKRSLREFYLRNLSRIPGTLGTAVGRLAAAREAIIGMPLEEGSEGQ